MLFLDGRHFVTTSCEGDSLLSQSRPLDYILGGMCLTSHNQNHRSTAVQTSFSRSATAMVPSHKGRLGRLTPDTSLIQPLRQA